MNAILEVAPDALLGAGAAGRGHGVTQPPSAAVRRLLRPRPVQREPLQPGRHDRHQRLGRPLGRLRGHQGPRARAGRSSWPTAASYQARPLELDGPELAGLPRRRHRWPGGPSPRSCPSFAPAERPIRAAHAPGGQELLRLPGRGRSRPGRPARPCRRDARQRRRTTARLAHLQRLFVGAEGTLGLVTEATLNLVPLPATARHRHGLLPLGLRRRGGGPRHPGPCAHRVRDHGLPLPRPGRASTTPASTPCCPSTPTRRSSSSSKGATTPNSTRSSRPSAATSTATAALQPGARHDRRRDRAPLEDTQVGRAP